ncbi:MAG: tRNA dihydrouridine synthase [Chloroflexota bacterium]
METNRQHTLRIGPLSLETPILLAPMAGYTGLPFRMAVRPLGGLGMAYAEMVNPLSVLWGGGKRRAEILATCPEDRPLGYQIYGTDPRLMVDTARWLEGQGATLIDINMGCPQREITSSGGGSALLKSPAEAAKLAEQVVGSVSVPVTVKLRLGWEAGSMVAPDLARHLEKAGVAAITIHGRTRAQAFSGEVDLDGIRRVVEAVERIPVIGNGDVTSPEAALRMLRETGCAGVMVARGAIRDPWLIRDVWQALQGLPPLPTPTRAERVGLLSDLFERSILHHGEKHAVPAFKKWIPEVSKKLDLSREAMIRLLRISEVPEMRQALAELG